MTFTGLQLQERVDLFLELLNKLYEDHFIKTGSAALGIPSPVMTAEWGNKNIKIVSNGRKRDRDTGEILPDLYSRSVYCFIDMKTGDLLKAAGWKAPAKGARGNIFNDNCDVGTRATLYGGGLYINR